MQKKHLILALLISCFSGVNGQVTIGSGTPPNENSLLDLNENGDGTSTKGILFPRVALVSISDPSPLSSHVEGMVVYNTTTSDSSVDAKSAVSPGTYYNDGNRWVLVSSTDKNPWGNSETLAPASTISDAIYHTGTVAVGGVETDPSAQMQVSSNNKGVLIPRISTTARDAISAPANGLMIFNTTTNCLNYYNETNNRWLNLCGGYDPATVVVLCENSEGAIGVYTAGSALNTTNTYKISVNVTSVGTYEIVAKTENGYTFAKSGLFTSTGTNVVELEGQGAPIKEGTDAVTLQNNGVPVSLTCTLPPVTVNPASIRYTINPSSTVYGTYYTGIGLDATNYIEVELNVTNGGILNLTSAAENGISFSSGSVTLEPGVQKVKLYGQGTPIKAGSFTGNTIVDESGNTLQPTIVVLSTKGTFDDPINRCQEILDENAAAPSDYYWIQDTSGKKFMTYCMMDNGSAWTLVKSMSENQILTFSNPTALQNEGLYNQTERNVTSTKDGVFNEYWFALSSATINNIGVTGGKQYKYTIKEQGHSTATTATMDEIKSTTLPAVDDLWAKENYLNVTVLSGNPANSYFLGSQTNHWSEGQIFGKTIGKNQGDYYHYFDGTSFIGFVYGFSSVDYYTGFYGTTTYAGNGAVTYTYHDRSDAGQGVTFNYNRNNINDLFGFYMNSEAQLNHHIGTCANSTDDFGGAATCAGGFANWRAHKFNQRPDGKYEGRIYQVWIK